jgi:competence protein ComEC
MVIDTGTRKGGRSIVAKLKKLGVDTVDLLVLTHPHADHIGGCRDLVESVRIKKVWISGFDVTTRTHQRTMENLQQRSIPVRTIRQGARLRLEPGLEIVAFAPEDPLVQRSRSPANANSIVLWIKHGIVDLLFTGDAEKETETRVLKVMENKGPPRFEILKVAHHGSRYATSLPFLSRVRPALGLISCGRNNRYGHPHPDVLGRLNRYGVKVLRTDKMGTFQLRSDGRSIRVYSRPGPASSSSNPSTSQEKTRGGGQRVSFFPQQFQIDNDAEIESRTQTR